MNPDDPGPYLGPQDRCDWYIDRAKHFIALVQDATDATPRDRHRWHIDRASHYIELAKLAATEARSPPPAAASPAISMRECSVCYEEKTLNQFPDSSAVSTHSHQLNTCLECYSHHIAAQIETQAEHVRCPDCREELNFDEIRILTSTTVFTVYEQALSKAFIERDEDFRKCMSPQCNSGQIHAGGANRPIFECQACGHTHCIVCEVPWHGGEDCEEYQARKRAEHPDNEKSEAKVRQTTKQCPNPKCGVRIEKNQGCDHMTCNWCQHEFCWLCFADWKVVRRRGGNSHETTCPLHPDYRHVIQIDDSDSDEELTDDDEAVDDDEYNVTAAEYEAGHNDDYTVLNDYYRALDAERRDAEARYELLDPPMSAHRANDDDRYLRFGHWEPRGSW